MNRLQKKCFIAATGFHLLLVLIVIIGPAFLSSSSKPVDVPIIDFIPVKTVDALASNSGGRSPAPQAPAPLPPASAPEAAPPASVPAPPEPVKQPVKEPVKEPAPQDDPAPVPPKVKPKLPNVSTTVVKPHTSNADTLRRAEDRERAAATERANANAAHAIASIANRLSSPTAAIGVGDGRGSGVAYANFLQAVKKIYTDAWIVPEGINDDSANVSVSITIARDGTVVSARIIDRSGNGPVDQSVQMTLDRVRRTPPLPDDAKENQRTVTIDFNVKAKLLG